MPKHKWYVHIDDVDDERYDEVPCHTITQRPNRGGWKTDSASDGYGLPKELAQWICDILNKSDEECPYVMDRWGCWIKKGKKDV